MTVEIGADEQASQIEKNGIAAAAADEQNGANTLSSSRNKNALGTVTSSTTQAAVSGSSDGKSPYANIRKQFVGIAVAQILVLFGLGVPKAYTLFTGNVITVECAPIDPVDLFRGEYADLRFKGISEIETQNKFKMGQSVYVVLAKSADKATWTATSCSKHCPKLADGEIVLKGKITDLTWTAKNKPRKIRVGYGFEHLFLPPGKSMALQNNARNLRVKLAVNNSGDAVIRQVFNQDKLIFDGSKLNQSL
jgi:uncharacterized membrane-anchored protein